MSYEVIEKNEYGVLVRNTTDNGDCNFCKYKKQNLYTSVCINRYECTDESYYLTDSEAAKLEPEQIFKDNLSEIDSIFNSDIDTTENKKLTANEFVIETRKLLLDISERTEFSKEWLTISDIDLEFGLSRKVIDGFRKKGLKSNQKTANGKILIRRTELEKFITKK